MKKWISGAAFVCLLILLFCLFDKLSYVKESNNSTFFFQNEPKDSIDVVVLGSSQVYCGVSPLTIWAEHGYSVYDLSTSLQPPWGSYSLAKQAIREQHPDVLILDVLLFTEQMENVRDQLGYFSHRVYDPMGMSLYKFYDVLTIPEIEDKAEMLFPLVLNHSRLEKGLLGAADFDYLTEEERQPLKGHEVVKRSTAVLPDNAQVNESLALPEVAEKYLTRIIELCEKKNVELLLIRTPGLNDETLERQYLRIGEIAEAAGVEFVDLNIKSQEFGLDPASDFTDDVGLSSHLNAYGSEKVSTWLGNHLAENYSLTDHRSDPAYADWESSLLYYHDRYDLEKVDRIEEFLQRVRTPLLKTVLMVYLEDGQDLSDELVSSLTELGSKAELMQDGDLRYYAIIEDGKISSELLRINKDIQTEFYLGDVWCELSVTDGSEPGGPFATFRTVDIFNNNKTLESRFPENGGIIVYDVFRESVMDQLTFDVTETTVSQRVEFEEKIEN